MNMDKISRKAHVGKEGSEPSSHITLAPERCDSGVILIVLSSLLGLVLGWLLMSMANAKDDWEKYDGPSQLGHKVTWEAQAAEAKKQAQAIERISALCHGEALVREHQQGVNRFDPLTYDINLKLCMKRRQGEKP